MLVWGGSHWSLDFDHKDGMTPPHVKPDHHNGIITAHPSCVGLPRGCLEKGPARPGTSPARPLPTLR